MELLIKNATVVTDGIELLADIGVSGGKVVYLGRLPEATANEIIDATGKFILPGLVDLGISLLAENEFCPLSNQAMLDLSAQALSGGVTTIVKAHSWEENRDFTDSQSEQSKQDEVCAFADFAYHYFISDWSENRRRHLKTAIASGQLASVWIARTGLASATPGPALLAGVLRELTDNVVAFTSLSDPILEAYYRNEIRGSGNTTPRNYPQFFPESIEAATLRTIHALAARSLSSRLVILGLSSLQAIAEYQKLREQGTPLIAGVKLPHLALSSELIEEESWIGGFPLTWPPLRGRADQQALWAALDAGLFNLVTSGHHPLPIADVRQASSDVTRAPIGCAGIAHLLPLVYSEGVAKWRLTLESLSMSACADPAKLAGLYPAKGSLQLGSDADIILFDPSADCDLPDAGNGWHADPFVGMPCSGAIDRVYLRGALVFSDSNPVGQPTGRYLDRRVSLG